MSKPANTPLRSFSSRVQQADLLESAKKCQDGLYRSERVTVFMSAVFAATLLTPKGEMTVADLTIPTTLAGIILLAALLAVRVTQTRCTLLLRKLLAAMDQPTLLSFCVVVETDPSLVNSDVRTPGGHGRLLDFTVSIFHSTIWAAMHGCGVYFVLRSTGWVAYAIGALVAFNLAVGFMTHAKDGSIAWAYTDSDTSTKMQILQGRQRDAKILARIEHFMLAVALVIGFNLS